MTKTPWWLAWATLIATVILLIVGGTVNPTGSSLACPDWPTCYGSFFPAMKDGVQYEHTHRVVATAVGLMTIALAWSMWRAEPRTRQRKMLGVAAVLMVVVQGVLGGLTVLLRLPPAVSAGHLALSMLVLCYFVVLTFLLRPGPRPAEPPGRKLRAARVAQAVAAAAVYLQILLGALVRHLHAGHACNDEFPWCGGQMWPAWGPAQLHMLHRWSAVGVSLVVVVASAIALASARRHGRVLAGRLAIAAPILVALQLLLGVLTVTSNIGVVEAAAHLGLGAILLADVVAGYLALGLPAVREVQAAPTIAVAKAEALS